ncbi:hypothetical protein SH139x_005245 [Planctomycetaceae bacterium SH139]
MFARVGVFSFPLPEQRRIEIQHRFRYNRQNRLTRQLGGADSRRYMDPFSTIIAPLSAAKAAQSVARPLLSAAGDFAQTLAGVWQADSTAAEPTIDAPDSAGLLEKIGQRLAEIVAAAKFPSSGTIELELSPLGNVYLNESQLAGRQLADRQLEMALQDDAQFMELLQRWAGVTEQRSLSLQLPANL